MGFRTSVSRLALFVTAVSTLGTTLSTAQECAQLSRSWPQGPADAVTVRHGRAYFGSGTLLVLGDVSNPNNPRIESTLDLGMLIGDIVADADRVWVAAGSFDGGGGALIEVDVSDVFDPQTISSIPLALPARCLVLSGAVAYVGLVDPQDPRGGQLVAMDPRFPDGAVTTAIPGWPEELALDGEMLWVTEFATGARGFSVEEGIEPLEVGFVAGDVRDASALGGVLYLADWDPAGHQMRVVDVTDPADPVDLASYPAPRPRKVEVTGPRAYLLSAPSETSIRFEVIDVSPPTDPERLGILTLGSTGGGDLLINNLTAAASIAYVTHSQGGPVVVNTLDATEPRAVATFPTPGLALNLDQRDGLLAVAGGSSGLWLVDLTDSVPAPPPPPPPAGGRPFAQDVALAHDHAFVASWGRGILVYDVSDPGQPVQVAVVESGYRFTRTVASGDHLYATFLGNPYLSTAIFDISDPTHPVELGVLQGSVLAVAGDHAYADWSDWLGQCALATWDVSDPANPGADPTRVNFWGGCARCDWPWPDYPRSYELDPHRSISGVTTNGDLAWVALGQGGLRLLSLEDPSSPRQVASLAIDACGVTGAVAHRGMAQVATHSPTGLLTVRLTGDGGLEETSFTPIDGYPVDVTTWGSEVATANQTAGVTALDVSSCQPPLRASGRRAP